MNENKIADESSLLTRNPGNITSPTNVDALIAEAERQVGSPAGYRPGNVSALKELRVWLSLVLKLTLVCYADVRQRQSR